MDSGDIVYAVERPTLDNHHTLLQATGSLLVGTQLAQGSLGLCLPVFSSCSATATLRHRHHGAHRATVAGGQRVDPR